LKQFSIYVETKGRSCNGCSKCCEGWLIARVFNFEISPTNGSCRFLGRVGCGIYPVRDTLCKNFYCDWIENSSLPENLKPDKCNAIIITKKLETYLYYRIVTAGIIKKYVYEWAEEQAKQGKHLVAYDQNGELNIYSNDPLFRSLAILEFEK
jgi:hypothetical protein